MKSKREYMVAVQLGIAGLGAAFGLAIIGVLKYFDYEHVADLTAGLVSGVAFIAIFFPRWMEKLRIWWRLEKADDRDAEMGKLYQQLEQERLAREAVEAEALELRQQRGTKALENIRGLLHDDLEYRALLERAEAAERMIESMDKQLGEQAEKIERDGTLIKRMAARLEGAPIAEPQETITDTGLAFPYATKQLEAMRDAAERFWQTHDRNLSAPYGIQKQVQNFLAERIGENARKTAELAAAIKPDDLPEA